MTTIKDGFGTVQYGYERDEKGRITGFTVHGVHRDFSYDGDDQITKGFAKRAYSYDDNFNRLDVAGGIGSDNRLLNDGKFKYVYDKNGNLLSKSNLAFVGGNTTVSYDYDQRN